MKETLRRLTVETSGQDLIEYALLAGFISLAAVLAIGNVGTALNGVWNGVDNQMTAGLDLDAGRVAQKPARLGWVTGCRSNRRLHLPGLDLGIGAAVIRGPRDLCTPSRPLGDAEGLSGEGTGQERQGLASAVLQQPQLAAVPLGKGHTLVQPLKACNQGLCR